MLTLIVTRRIEQADALAKRVNELAGRVVAVAHHSKRPALPQELLDSDVLIITHQAYVNAAEHLGSPRIRRTSSLGVAALAS